MMEAGSASAASLRRTTLPALAFLLGFWALFLANGRAHSNSADTIPNELLPISILQEGNFDLNEFVPSGTPLPYYFREISGRVVSAYPIVPGVLNLPVYALARLAGADLIRQRTILSKLTASFLTAASVAFLYLALGTRFKRRTAAWMAVLYGLGTCAWAVAGQGIWQHGPSLALLTLVLVLLLQDGDRWVAYSGFFLGLAVFNRPTNVILALLLTMYVARRRRNVLPGFLMLAAVPAVLMFAYSWVYFHSPVALGQGQAYAEFNGNMLAGLAGLLISPNRGLLVFSPMFLFALLPLGAALLSRKSDMFMRLLAWDVVLTLLLYSRWRMWWGGWCFGYRVLIELLPALMFFLAQAWESYGGRRILRWGMIALAAVSVFAQFLGAFHYPAGFNWTPDNVDFHPRRLWQARDSELARCFELFLRHPFSRPRVSLPGVPEPADPRAP
jgi:hypothetical protein